MTKTHASLGVLAVTLATVATLFLLPYTPKTPVRTATIQRGEWKKTSLLEGVGQYRRQEAAACLTAGILKRVYVAEGEAVEEGRLLFSLDSDEEERALEKLAASRRQMEQTVETFGQAASLWSLSAGMELETQETALRRSVALKQIRAGQAGRMGAIYRQEGEAVQAGELLGMIHSEERCIVSACRAESAARLQTGMEATIREASGKALGRARLVSIGAPAANASGGEAVQTLVFELEEGGTCEIGARYVIELESETRSNVPLAPLEAVDADGCIWIVENGCAWRVELAASGRGGQAAEVPEELLGKRAILDPEESGLTPGRPVKEARAR